MIGRACGSHRSGFRDQTARLGLVSKAKAGSKPRPRLTGLSTVLPQDEVDAIGTMCGRQAVIQSALEVGQF